MNLTDPSVLTQGPGLVNLTNGTQAAAVTTLIKGIMKIVPSSYGYGIGGNKIYRFNSTAVTNSGDWPHTIDKAVVTSEDGEDICYYNTYIYYSYNHSGTLGDIGRYKSGSFDDDYMSTVPTDATTLVGSVPHPMVVGGNDILYIGNGRYVASYNYSTTTFVNQALDLPADEIITSLVFENNRLYIITRNGGTTATAYNEGSIYLWDTTSSSWEYQIKLVGRAGGSITKNGIIWIFYTI